MKIVIHNFYGKKAPSGEDEFVRKQEKDYSFHVFSEILYLSKYTLFSTYLKFRAKTNRRMRRLINNVGVNDIIEVHNITPFIDTRLLLKLSKKTNLNLYAHNFRLVAPCGVLMDAKGNPCNLCVKHKYAVLLSPIWKCYRKSRFHTLILMLYILRQRLFRHFKYVDKVITFSNTHQQALKSLFGEVTKFDIIKNITDDQLDQYKPIRNHFSAVYLGRLTEEKGILKLIEHWKKFDMGELHIFGDGELKVQVEKSIVGFDNIRFHGFLTKNNKLAELAKHSTMIIPSLCSEGYPTVISDALNSNLNLISTDIEPQASHVKALGGDVYHYESAESLFNVVTNLKG